VAARLALRIVCGKSSPDWNTLASSPGSLWGGIALRLLEAGCLEVGCFEEGWKEV
jgi:hypothetical protein